MKKLLLDRPIDDNKCVLVEVSDISLRVFSNQFWRLLLESCVGDKVLILVTHHPLGI